MEDPLQADWDDIAEKLVHAINNSETRFDQERNATLPGTRLGCSIDIESHDVFHLPNSIEYEQENEPANPKRWRRESNRQREVALKLAMEYQVREKARRAREHNESFNRPKRHRHSKTDSRANSEDDESLVPQLNPIVERDLGEVESHNSHTTTFREDDQVWLFMERVKQGLKKKLAHRWHGPFRVKRQVEEFAYELELPDKSGYRFYPIVHISRLKRVKELSERPTTGLVGGLDETDRFAFDDDILLEDS